MAWESTGPLAPRSKVRSRSKNAAAVTAPMVTDGILPQAVGDTSDPHLGAVTQGESRQQACGVRPDPAGLGVVDGSAWPMNLQKAVFRRIYRTTPTVEALPWHRDEPPSLLERAIADRSDAGRALDLGCGDGVYAVHLAQQGYSVVATDFVDTALDATRERAERAGVDIRLQQCDVIDYQDSEPFDIVLDSGCLHHLPKGKIGSYRSRLDEWLAPGGSFVLVHFLHRPRVKWIPKGPRHLTRREATTFLAPFALREYEETEFDVPFPMGQMRAGIYWFSRPTI